jgi:hypothetical protein
MNGDTVHGGGIVGWRGMAGEDRLGGDPAESLIDGNGLLWTTSKETRCLHRSQP